MLNLFKKGLFDETIKEAEILSYQFPKSTGVLNVLAAANLANGNLESGFVDRQLFMPKLTNNRKLNRGQICLDVVEAYNNSIYHIPDYKRHSENSTFLNQKYSSTTKG